MTGPGLAGRELSSILLPAITLIAIETLVVQQYWPSLFAMVWALVRLIRGRARRQALVVALAGVLGIGVNVMLTKRAAHQAAVVIVAVERHRKDRGEYPKSLDELVPAYLPSLPRAKPGLFGEFGYMTRATDDALLYWVVLPPFGRRTYAFAERRSGSLD